MTDVEVPALRCPVTNKVCWASRKAARAGYRPQPGDRRRFSAFRCGWCNWVHIGHK